MVDVVVDVDLCESNGLCVAVAPDVFDLDDEGTAQVVGTVTANNDAQVRSAVLACPKAALRLEE
jgi:ferredoxin